MSVTDLTGTTWEWNSTIPASAFSIVGNDWHINFTSNSTNYVLLTQIQDEDDDDICKLIYGSTLAYNATNNIWTNNAYKTIEITDGTDVTNPDLIALIEANATQVAPTSSNKISVGSLPLSKMFVGNVEVSKAILNGVTLYEKSTELSTFTFTFTGQSYQFEEGMSWSEWVSSDYNPGGFHISGLDGSVAFQESVPPGTPTPPPVYLSFDNRSVYGPDPVRTVTYGYGQGPF